MQHRQIYRTALIYSAILNITLYVIILFAFIYIRNSVMPEEHRNEISEQTMLIHLWFDFIETFLLSFVLYVLSFRILSMDLKLKIRIFLQNISSFAVAMMLSILFANILLCVSNHYESIKEPFLPGMIIRDLFLSGFIILISLLKYMSDKQQQTALENKTLIAENMRTRYEALKNQVDPHFLFNSLNTLNALIKIDTDKAQQYVQQLSYVFRYTLQNKEIISLEEELNFTRAYCHLMQIRYGDSLRFVYSIDDRFNHYSIIPLSLQTLVENAIKHNVVTAKQPLTISFTTNDSGTVCVSNPIQLKKELESGEGIGLVNLSERYRLMWQQGIVIKQNDGIFRVEIVLNEP